MPGIVFFVASDSPLLQDVMPLQMQGTAPKWCHAGSGNHWRLGTGPARFPGERAIQDLLLYHPRQNHSR
jgi:hypothetical protein